MKPRIFGDLSRECLTTVSCSQLLPRHLPWTVPQSVPRTPVCFLRSIIHSMVSNGDAANEAQLCSRSGSRPGSHRGVGSILGFRIRPYEGLWLSPASDRVFSQLKWLCHSGIPVAIQSFCPLSKDRRGEGSRGWVETSQGRVEALRGRE